MFILTETETHPSSLAVELAASQRENQYLRTLVSSLEMLKELYTSGKLNSVSQPINCTRLRDLEYITYLIRSADPIGSTLP